MLYVLIIPLASDPLPFEIVSYPQRGCCVAAEIFLQLNLFVSDGLIAGYRCLSDIAGMSFSKSRIEKVVHFKYFKDRP
jgi:hypothetical protein